MFFHAEHYVICCTYVLPFGRIPTFHSDAWLGL